MLFSDSIILELICFWFLIVYCVYYYFTKTFNHWKEKGVAYEAPTPFFGNTKSNLLTKTHVALDVQILYNKFPNEGFFGMFILSRPVLVIRDPELIKQIFVKDFNHFPNRGGTSSNHKVEPLCQHLFNLEGQQWRELRQKLTPTFTSGKMKFMFNLLAECAEEFNSYLKEITAEQENFETRDLSANYTTQVIGSCVFGVQNNSIRDPNTKFREIGRKMTAPSIIKSFKRQIRSFVPKFYNFLNMKTTDDDAEEFFLDIAKHVVEHREKNNITRKDFIQLLIDLKKNETKGLENSVMDETFFASQLFIFFLAGFDTASSTMSFCLYELALNPDVQLKVQQEIDTILQKYGGKMTYEGFLEMQYFDKVLCETLRKYPLAGNLLRRCSIAYTIPDSKVSLDVGDSLIIPIYAIHYDQQYFPDPHKFDPERFSDENKQTRHPFSYLPFGEGPRICIGMRFAKFQMLAGLIAILKDFSVSPTDKTVIPLEFSGISPILQSTHGVWLQMKSRH